MSDATTGVPAANASVSTMPNDSPPSEGAHNTSAERNAATLTASSTRPRAVPPPQPLEGRQQQREALALHRLPDERDPQRLPGQPRAHRRRPEVHAVRDH